MRTGQPPDPSMTRWDIFHYVYTILHHPDYRQRYAANLRRELPRIPFVCRNATLIVCHSEPAKAGEESAVPGRVPHPCVLCKCG